MSSAMTPPTASSAAHAEGEAGLAHRADAIGRLVALQSEHLAQERPVLREMKRLTSKDAATVSGGSQAT